MAQTTVQKSQRDQCQSVRRAVSSTVASSKGRQCTDCKAFSWALSRTACGWWRPDRAWGQENDDTVVLTNGGRYCCLSTHVCVPTLSTAAAAAAVAGCMESLVCVSQKDNGSAAALLLVKLRAAREREREYCGLLDHLIKRIPLSRDGARSQLVQFGGRNRSAANRQTTCPIVTSH